MGHLHYPEIEKKRLKMHTVKLGVSRKSSLAEINAAFSRKLSRQHHPDSPGGDTAKFIDITVAIGMIRLAFEEADADWIELVRLIRK